MGFQLDTSWLKSRLDTRQGGLYSRSQTERNSRRCGEIGDMSLFETITSESVLRISATKENRLHTRITRKFWRALCRYWDRLLHRPDSLQRIDCGSMQPGHGGSHTIEYTAGQYDRSRVVCGGYLLLSCPTDTLLLVRRGIDVPQTPTPIALCYQALNCSVTSGVAVRALIQVVGHRLKRVLFVHVDPSTVADDRRTAGQYDRRGCGCQAASSTPAR